MKRLRTYLITLAALLSPALAFAQIAPMTRVETRDNILSAAPLTSTQTIIVDLGKQATPSIVSQWAKARLSVFYTYGAATSVTVKFYCAIDGTNYAQLTQRLLDGTNSALASVPDAVTGTSDFQLMPEYDLRGCRKAKWVFTGGGSPTSSDVVTADLALIAGD